MVAPALLSLALSALAAMAAAPPSSPSLSVSPSDPRPRSPFTVTCSSGHLADPSATATITANGTDQQVATDHQGQRATALVTLASEGRVRLGCSVRAGGVESRTDGSVEVFYIPRPVLNVSLPVVSGSFLRARCSLPAGSARDAQLRLRLLLPNGTAAGPGWGRPPLDLGFPLPGPDPREEEEEEEEEEELELSCEARLAPFTPRTESRRVPVMAPPRLDPRLCPPRQNWTEGLAGVLRCRARGRPRPLLECSGAGNSTLPAGIPIRARPIHAGIYRCRARNGLGVAESDVTVRVVAPEQPPLLPALLGTLLPLLTLLILAGLFLLRRHRARIGHYRLWKGRRPPGGHQGVTRGPPGGHQGHQGQPGATRGPPGGHQGHQGVTRGPPGGHQGQPGATRATSGPLRSPGHPQATVATSNGTP